MDAFFASVEQRDFPELKGRPVIVGGNPQGRGVVAAASYEARVYGVHSAMPSSRAVKLCRDAVFRPPRVDVYRDVSRQIRELFYEYTPDVEPLSMDEAYLDVTANLKKNPSATLIARDIRARIRKETGLTASAGVAGNKFLAKIASDMNKPDGLFIITPGEAASFLEELEIRKFYGVGKATMKKMDFLGIRNGKDLKEWSERDLVRHFGKQGHHFFRIVRGIDNREVKPHRIRKSIGKERTFSKDISDIRQIQYSLKELSEKVSMSLNRHQASGKTVTLKVRYRNFETVTRSITFQHYIRNREEIADTAVKLLDETEAGNRHVRLLGITLSSLNLENFHMGEQLEIVFDNSSMSDCSGIPALI